MFLNKRKVKVEKILFPLIYMVLYRTKIGLRLMDNLAKRHPKFTGVFAFLSVVFGFTGMVLIVGLLIKGTYTFLFLGGTPPVAPLFPGVKTVPGLPVMSFFHWILAIFILAGVHEFSHGWIARLYNIKVKSSGFAVFSFILPIIPAAFVEPDEKELESKGKKEQLGVLAAGSFSNMVTSGIFFLLFLFVLTPVASSIMVSEGVVIVDVVEEGPASLVGVGVDEKVQSINGIEILSIQYFIEHLSDLQAGDSVSIETDVKNYEIIAGEKPEDGGGYVGLSFAPEKQYISEKYGIFGGIIPWLTLLTFWIFVANLGVGLFNLLPMGPLDGGKMFYLVSLSVFKKEERAKKVWMGVSFFCLALIVISLLPFFGRLLSFVFGVFTGLF